MNDSCTCGFIKIGSEVTEHRNWNPYCAAHGTQTKWWKSPEQVSKRAAQSEHLRELQARARHARTGVWPDYWQPPQGEPE